jgi:ABC-type dipeptide/oligopeptide/nickel transport system permease component
VLGFVLRRAAGGVLSIVGVSLLVFLFLHMVPGDPVDNLAGGEATPDQRQDVIECMHLDKSMPRQFVIFLENVVNGSLGRQCAAGRERTPVIDRVKQVFPYTIELALASMLVAILLALPLGVIAATRRGTMSDAAVTVVSVLGVSMPIPWMGPMLISIFYVWLGVLPGPAEPDTRFALVMPSIVLGTHFMAMLARMTRSSLLDVLREDYMQTARAKGLVEAAVILKHGLRNALLPVITVAGMQFGSVLAGAIVTEQIFERPGLGTLIYTAIKQRNYPVVQGCVLVIAVIYVSVNVAVDLAYGVADPRIRRA